eukprot:2197125-Rhodomonas_salina.2
MCADTASGLAAGLVALTVLSSGPPLPYSPRDCLLPGVALRLAVEQAGYHPCDRLSLSLRDVGAAVAAAMQSLDQ